MGSSESKPSYPTEDQWQEHRTEVLRKVTDKLTSMEQTRVEQIPSDIEETLGLFNKYMYECNDKIVVPGGAGKNLTYAELGTHVPGQACTDARNAMIRQAIVMYNKHANTPDANEVILKVLKK